MAEVGPSTASEEIENVPCPFCGMICDDLTVKKAAGGLKVEGGCPRAVAGFERRLPDAKPQIDGRPVPLQQAITAAADLLRNSRNPIVTGLGTDVAGVRAAIALAERAGAVIDHAQSDSSFRNYRVLQTGGWVTTTLTEARNRADLFVIVGSDIKKYHARFFEKIVNPPSTMFPGVAEQRTVVVIGDNIGLPARGARVSDVISIPCKPERIAEVLDALRALAKGATLPATTIGGVPRAAIDDLLTRCKAAKYAVFTWISSSLEFGDADITVQAICEFIKEANATTRVAGLALGGAEGSTTAGYVTAWQTGFPLRVSFASGAPQYDPERYSWRRLVAEGACDVLLWVASFSPDLSPPDGKFSDIVLGTPGLKLQRTPKVFIPIGTPGVDHAGSLVRVDGSVALPLKNVGRSNYPRAADILAQIEAAY